VSALKKHSPEWIAEAQRAPALLRAALDDPDDEAAMNEVVDALERLGFVVPKSPQI
jgi:hypothetical protein